MSGIAKLIPAVFMAAITGVGGAQAGVTVDRLVQTSYCPAHSEDGKNRDFLLTHHLTQEGTWWMQVAPAPGSIAPHMPVRIDPAKAEMHEGVKDSGIKPFVIVSGNVQGPDYVYVVNSTLTVEGGAVTQITANMIGSKDGADDLSVLSTVTCGNPPAEKPATTKAKAKSKSKTKAKQK